MNQLNINIPFSVNSFQINHQNISRDASVKLRLVDGTKIETRRGEIAEPKWHEITYQKRVAVGKNKQRKIYFTTTASAVCIIILFVNEISDIWKTNLWVVLNVGFKCDKWDNIQHQKSPKSRLMHTRDLISVIYWWHKNYKKQFSLMKRKEFHRVIKWVMLLNIFPQK